MARPGVIVVHVEHVATDLGLWCTDCATSGGARVWFTRRSGNTLRLCSAVGCTDCGGSNVEAGT